MRSFALVLTFVLVNKTFGESGNIHMSLGWGNIKEFYDSTGATYKPDYSVNLLNLHLGGRYNLFQTPPLSFSVGGCLRFQKLDHSYENQTISSGFSPQNLNLWLGLGGPFYGLRIGGLLDLGPEPDTNKIPNSDRQNSLLLNGSLNIPNPFVSLSVGLDYFLTLEKTENENSFDWGDYLNTTLNIGYKLPTLGSIGLGISYVIKTKAKINDQESPNSDGYLLSLIPYLYLRLPFMPLHFSISLSAMEEYTYYGISILGKNMPVTRLGLTLRAGYSF